MTMLELTVCLWVAVVVGACMFVWAGLFTLLAMVVF